MANQEMKNAKGTPEGFVYLPLLAGWLIPGAGHFLLRKWGRGALICASITCMFALGIASEGKIFTAPHDIMDLLRMIGDMGNGALYLVGRVGGLGADQVRTTSADYGSIFIMGAGLLNIMAAVDAHNLRTGRKAS
jgi:hypothetical protein